MQKIEAQFEIVTPMFIGGANKEDDPEIRPPSIKGALRFWWRALQWGHCLKQAQNNSEAALQVLHKQEAELFGAAVNDESGGQGKILLKLKNAPFNKANLNKLSAGQQYLLGQGLYNYKQGLLKQSLEKEQSFSVVLILDNQAEVQSVIDALMIFGLLGGLGSRSRKGWGSASIKALSYSDKDGNLAEIAIPDNKNVYQQTLKKILGDVPVQIPPFSAFSQKTRIDISASSIQAIGLLTTVGEEMQMYRSYGKEMSGVHKVNGKEAEQNFKLDHDVVLDFARRKKITQHPKRTVFGLPHNYYYSDGTKVDVDAEKFSRRASPLIIHIHKFPSGECMAVQSLLVAKFLPDNEKIQLKSKRNSQSLNCQEEWSVITTYLDRFKNRQTILGGGSHE